MPAGFWQTDREHEEADGDRSEALKIADSIAESAKSTAGDLQKTQARRDEDPDHGGSAATPTPTTQLGDCRWMKDWRASDRIARELAGDSAGEGLADGGDATSSAIQLLLMVWCQGRGKAEEVKHIPHVRDSDPSDQKQ